MKDTITQSEIERIDQVYHKLVVSTQKTSEELWKDKLQGLSTIEVSILRIMPALRNQKNSTV